MLAAGPNMPTPGLRTRRADRGKGKGSRAGPGRPGVMSTGATVTPLRSCAVGPMHVGPDEEGRGEVALACARKGERARRAMELGRVSSLHGCACGLVRERQSWGLSRSLLVDRPAPLELVPWPRGLMGLRECFAVPSSLLQARLHEIALLDLHGLIHGLIRACSAVHRPFAPWCTLGLAQAPGLGPVQSRAAGARARSTHLLLCVCTSPPSTIVPQVPQAP